MWQHLDTTWQQVFTLAWASYKRGTVPVGAVIKDSYNHTIATGRNKTYDPVSSHVLAGTCMGHAEMIALMQLEKKAHPNIDQYTLYVGLEPCPMCFGTMVMMGIKDVVYAANDGAAGASELRDKMEYIQSKDICITKQGGEMEIFQIILQTSRGQFNPIPEVMTEWESHRPGAVKLGKLLHKVGYFKNAQESKLQICDVYDTIMQRYYTFFSN